MVSPIVIIQCDVVDGAGNFEGHIHGRWEQNGFIVVCGQQKSQNRWISAKCIDDLRVLRPHFGLLRIPKIRGSSFDTGPIITELTIIKEARETAQSRQQSACRYEPTRFGVNAHSEPLEESASCHLASARETASQFEEDRRRRTKTFP